MNKMLLRKTAIVLALTSFSLAAIGCAALTREEAAEAVAEAALEAEASALTSGTIEITTDFTIGEAVEAAADEIRTFVETQLPCADVVLEGATLTVTYGARGGMCTYRGQSYSGTHSVSVMRNQMDEVIVEHTWTELSNGRVSVTGGATVTWSFADRTRRVVHELVWTRLSDGHTGTGRGDRLQGALPEGIATGFTVSGDRSWEGESGLWTLDIDAVQMRWVDPIPQAGTYTLGTPFGKTLSMNFERVDGDSIQVTVASGARSFDIVVNSAPMRE